MNQSVEVLEQLLFAMSGARWLEQPDDKPSLQSFHLQAVQQAFLSCLFSGAFEQIDESVISSTYERLLGIKWSEFVDEYKRMPVNAT